MELKEDRGMKATKNGVKEVQREGAVPNAPGEAVTLGSGAGEVKDCGSGGGGWKTLLQSRKHFSFGVRHT